MAADYRMTGRGRRSRWMGGVSVKKRGVGDTEGGDTVIKATDAMGWRQGPRPPSRGSGARIRPQSSFWRG